MYKNQGGKKITLQGLDVHLPPEPPRYKIQGNHLSVKNQKWKRTELPSFEAKDIKIWSGTEYEPNQELSWDMVRREEYIKQTGYDPWENDSKGKPKKVQGIESDLSYVNHKLEAFRKQEIERCKNGHWFMLAGKPTYLTGFTYAYFNWWKIPNTKTGYPDYRQYVTDLGYVIEVVRQDFIRLGLILASMRGIGKTYYSLCVQYFITIFRKTAYSGMQSKNDDSAAGMWRRFSECISKLPEFLVPINNFGNTVTKESISFKAPKAKHPNPFYDRWMRNKELSSTVDYKNATDRAYDSETLYVLLQDEIGKIESPNNIINRFDVIRHCVYRGNTKTGFILGFTTVGNMEKGGGDQFKSLYENADLKKVTETGWTLNGCVKYFISALDATKYDEYGKSDRKASKEFHDANRKALKQEGDVTGDYTSYIAYCQNNPYTEEEAFMIGGKECLFNASILQSRQFVASREDYTGVVRGDLEWVDEKWGKVKFVPNAVNGLWEISTDLEGKPFLPEDFVNKTTVQKRAENVYSVKLPNDNYFSAGMDPTSHRYVLNKNKASKPAITVQSKSNFHWPEDLCNTPIAHYVGRIESPKEQAEHAIMASLFFGMQILIEKNKSNVSDYITDWGFLDILMTRPGSRTLDPFDVGANSNTQLIDQYTALAKDDIIENGKKLRILQIIKDALEFNTKDTTKFDSFVSYGLSLVAAEKYKGTDTMERIDVNSLFKTFDHSGTTSQFN